MPPVPRFHLAIAVDDLDASRAFYGDLLGCEPGRSSGRWIDWNLHGHQLVTHVAPGGRAAEPAHNPVDGHEVPIPHFGLILAVEEFQALADRLTGAGVAFVIEPYVRFAGEPGEQWTMFLLDPSGNAIEFKAFADDAQVFAT